MDYRSIQYLNGDIKKGSAVITINKIKTDLTNDKSRTIFVNQFEIILEDF